MSIALEPTTGYSPNCHYQEFIRYHEHLLRYARKLTGNHHDAQDLVQETFLRAFRYHGNFELGTNAKSWLHKVMYHLFISTLRKRKAIRLEDLETLDGSTVIANKTSEVPGLTDEISNALQALNPNFRTPLLLKIFLGYKYWEISLVMGVPVATIKTRIHRAKRLLASQLIKFSTKT